MKILIFLIFIGSVVFQMVLCAPSEFSIVFQELIRNTKATARPVPPSALLLKAAYHDCIDQTD